jgi:hypothetical protein
MLLLLHGRRGRRRRGAIVLPRRCGANLALTRPNLRNRTVKARANRFAIIMTHGAAGNVLLAAHPRDSRLHMAQRVLPTWILMTSFLMHEMLRAIIGAIAAHGFEIVLPGIALVMMLIFGDLPMHLIQQTFQLALKGIPLIRLSVVGLVAWVFWRREPAVWHLLSISRAGKSTRMFEFSNALTF